jgi:hypothetical protein
LPERVVIVVRAVVGEREMEGVVVVEVELED